MQVILKQNVPALGRKGEVKNVKEGYFHNFLQPRNLAEVATDGKVAQAKDMMKKQLIEKDRVKEQAQEIKEKLNGLELVLVAKANGEKLYGSILEKDIAELIQKKINVRLGKDHIMLKEHIKLIGKHMIPIKLADGVETKVSLEIKAE